MDFILSLEWEEYVLFIVKSTCVLSVEKNWDYGKTVPYSVDPQMSINYWAGLLAIQKTNKNKMSEKVRFYITPSSHLLLILCDVKQDRPTVVNAV